MYYIIFFFFCNKSLKLHKPTSPPAAGREHVLSTCHVLGSNLGTGTETQFPPLMRTGAGGDYRCSSNPVRCARGRRHIGALTPTGGSMGPALKLSAEPEDPQEEPHVSGWKRWLQ